MALWNLLLRRFASYGADLSFSTAKIASCSGPPPEGLMLTSAVSSRPSSALLQTRSISTELVCSGKSNIDLVS